ncbi:MAG: Na+/H+ antiporter subunit E [Dethiobacteria bacterium]
MTGKDRGLDIKGLIFMFILLMGFWLLMSLSYDWQHLLVGSLLSVFLVAFWNKLNREDAPHTGFNIKQLGLVIVYIVCLIYEIIKANISVALIVLNPRLPISPGVIVLREDLNRDLPKVFYANSITLTPGTITVKLEDDRLMVHAITRDAAEGVEDWYLHRLMKKIEGGG